MIAEIVYMLCALASTGCVVLLLREYFKCRSKLILWTSICFIGLAFNNTLLFVDLIIGPVYDLSLPRVFMSFIGLSILLFGLGRVFKVATI